jgi:predicted protein tyrosine phosphatase
MSAEMEDEEEKEEDMEEWMKLACVPDDDNLTWKSSALTMGVAATMGSSFGVEEPVSISALPGRLYLGNSMAATTAKVLQLYDITHILSVLDVPVAIPPIDQLLECRYLRVYDWDHEPVSKHFHEICGWIDDILSDPDNRLLIHCFMGVSRSATIVLAYWNWKRCFASIQQSVIELRQYRSMINPNPGFCKQLHTDIWFSPVLLKNLPPYIHSMSHIISPHL